MKIVLREPVLSCYYDFTDPSVRRVFLDSLNLPDEFGAEILEDIDGHVFYITKMIIDGNGSHLKTTHRSMDINVVADRGSRRWIKEGELNKIKLWVSGLRLASNDR